MPLRGGKGRATEWGPGMGMVEDDPLMLSKPRLESMRRGSKPLSARALNGAVMMPKDADTSPANIQFMA